MRKKLNKFVRKKILKIQMNELNIYLNFNPKSKIILIKIKL